MPLGGSCLLSTWAGGLEGCASLQVCFDKTGTLTEPGLSLQGVASTEHTADGRCKLGPVQPHLAVAAPALQLVAATCHGLAELDGQLVGDPLDQIVFQVGCSLNP